MKLEGKSGNIISIGCRFPPKFTNSGTLPLTVPLRAHRRRGPSLVRSPWERWSDRAGTGWSREGAFQGQPVAVKVFFSLEEASWQREKDVYETCRLQHPNVLGKTWQREKDAYETCRLQHPNVLGKTGIVMSIDNQKLGIPRKYQTQIGIWYFCPKFLGIFLVFYPHFENALVKFG